MRINIFRTIKYWYWRKYKNIPHPNEVLDMYCKAMPQSVEDKNKYKGAEFVLDYIWYIHGPETIKIIAEENTITRERVKQCIWKYYRKWKNLYERN